MADNLQVIDYIKFQLEQLSAKNAHHEFEQMCLHLARARICSNILPATGPVSAGGDQGRDFETFRSYLRSTPIANSTFVGKVSQKPIAFACSLQRNGILAKMKADVDLIMASGEPVEAIYYFSTLDIGVMARHKLQTWVQQKYSLKFEIFDKQAISNQLCDREIFWVAQKFLNIPSEIYPRSDNEPDEYKKTLALWKERKAPDLTYADFYPLTMAARDSAFSSDMKQDLPFWIGLLKSFIENDVPPQLRRKAIYEIAVVSLRGLGTLLGQEGLIREYFENILKSDDVADLEDASALLNYCSYAIQQNIIQLAPVELNVYRNNLIKRVEEMIKKVETPTYRSLLFELRGYLALYVDPSKPSMPDTRESIKWWTQLIDIAKNAPLFPLERFADRLTGFTQLIGECPGFDYLTQQTDLLLSQRHGSTKAAEKCRDRAMEFYKSGKKLKAINQLHQAKVKWFAEETLYGSLLSMLLISEWYRELGLSFAAKYYALAAAHVSLHSKKPEVKKLVSRALLAAAECDYSQGAWYGFLELTDMWFRAYRYFSPDAKGEGREFERILFDLTTLMAVTNRLDDRLFPFVETWVKRWKIDDWLENPLKMAHDVWKTRDISEIWKIFEEQLADRPFNDVGTMREAKFSELGITWEMSWANDYETNAEAEQLVAILQILLADMANVDLCLLKTNVSVSISVADVLKPSVDALPSNRGRNWRIVLPKYSLVTADGGVSHLNIAVFAVVTSILEEISLLPLESFKEALENCFKNGISMKAFVARQYDFLYREFVTEKIFASLDIGKTIPEADREFKLRESSELSWISYSGPTYRKEDSNEYLKDRYEGYMKPIICTLKKLKENRDYLSLVKRLRGEGWLDWHILGATSGIAVNYRVFQNSEAQRNLMMQNILFQALADDVETPDLPTVPVEEFTEEKMRLLLNVIMVSSLKIYKLECHQETPDFDAIAHFLRHRYNYFSDDIPHPDPFI
jgi:hypothetical protein